MANEFIHSTSAGQNCPHCGAPNEPGSAFCAACGLAVPATMQATPRILMEGEVAGSSMARQLQIEELGREGSKASIPLAVVAVFQFFTAFVIFAMMKVNPDIGEDVNSKFSGFLSYGVIAAVAFIGVLFLLLYFWARKNPFPAAIVGLGLFITVHLVDALADPAAIMRGIIIKIIIISLLIKAMSAGARHRRLLRGAAPA